MGIRYELASDIQEKVNEMATMLFPHVKIESVVCLRSFGSSSRGTIARCHALGKAMQLALGRKGFYVIEIISKRFDRLSDADKLKTLIHELMHIPKTFGGGFIHHNYVHEKNVDKVYEHYINLKGRRNNADLNNFLDNKKDNYDQEEDEKNLTKDQRIEKEFFVINKKKKWWF